MGDTIICESCQAENPGDAITCQRCGQPLKPSSPIKAQALPTNPAQAEVTLSASQPVPKRSTGTQPKADKTPSPDGIALVVRGYDRPVVITEAEFILGRYDPASPQQGVDLMPYGGGSMGVSRQHARILRKGGIYLIEDLNSTNGTWVNRHRLASGATESLQDGDIIQLGQLVMRLYFDTAEALRATEERISFRSPMAQLTPDYLAHRVSPYLLALAGVQEISDEILERETAIEIGAITVDAEAQFTVQISGTRDALKLVKTEIKTWRDANTERISLFLRMKQSLRKQTSVLMNNIGPASSTEEVAARELGRELREAEVQLARSFLSALAPYQAQTLLEPYVDMLVKHIHVLVFSPLNVTSDTHSLVH